jgi:arylamine N-acetyltransferase
MRLTALDHGQVEAYLDRLGKPQVRHDADGLARLQTAHLMAVPFHNLLLLANDGRPWALQPLPKVVDDAIAGAGGNCDRTTPPFTALLQAVGFDAHLAAATVREPGDHFVSVVHAGGRRYLCDVGNGHPYLRPWDLDGPAQEQEFQGWRFRFDPNAQDGPTLWRALPEGELKPVYVVDPSPRAYEAFAPIVTAHYTQVGFGPFLSGVRAVSITPDAVLTLRDAEYARDTRFGRSTRRVGGRDAARGLLTERFALPSRLVDEALEVVARRRPELFATPRWFALGRGHVRESVGLETPTREDVPDVLVSFATVGRAASVQRLLRTLAEEVRASGYPGRVGVLIVENHQPGDAAPDAAPPGITVHRVAIGDLRPSLDRAAAAGVLPPVTSRLPAPIATAREAQLAAIREHLRTPLPGLPHPSEHALVVWMVDDDVAFQQIDAHGRIERHTHLLFRAARFWAEWPQHAVILGTFTGDPPIPGLDGLSGQLGDLSDNVCRMLTLGPDAPWQPPAQPGQVFDAYYDLSEAQVGGDGSVWPYAPERAGDRVGDVALDLLRDVPRLLDGQQLTRALTWNGADVAPSPSLRRGGNTLFLDLDALFRWPTPALRSADGVTTRRADTLWAALAQAEAPGAVVEATLPLLHGREGQAGHPGQVTVMEAAKHTAAQVRGVVLARALTEGRDVALELATREGRVTEHRRMLSTKLAVFRELILGFDGWSDARLEAPLIDALRALDTLADIASAGAPLPGDPRELTAFLRQLPEAARVWRGGW